MNADESPYVEMTRQLVRAFPEWGGVFAIEPDASSGSYFVAADWLLARDESLPVTSAAGPVAPPRAFAPGQTVGLRGWPESDGRSMRLFLSFCRCPGKSRASGIWGQHNDRDRLGAFRGSAGSLHRIGRLRCRNASAWLL